MIGEMIAHYRVTAKLGEGGMGIVYRATDTHLDRDVAIKVLPAEVASTPDRMARFEREAKVLALLNHPNIATVYGVERGALVMELVEGPTLADRMDAGPMPLEDVIGIAKQIAEALEAAHEKGVVHRDLKPNNVKITPEGAVKLLDFGLAKAVENAKQTVVLDPVNSPTIVAGSIAGVIMGTAGYMSPEQAKGHPVDRRADIWAFGVVLHEMLTGRRLFDDGTVAEAIADILRRDIDLKELPASTPPAIRTLVGRCLDRNVKTRLRDIGEARIALCEPMTPPEPVRPTRRSLSWLWVAATAAAALAVGAVAGWRWKPQPLQPVQLDLRLPSGTSSSTGRGALDIVRLSPDGRTIAFIARGADSRPLVWLRRLSTDRVQALTGTEGAIMLFWSPDSRNLAFVAEEKLKRVDIVGGAVSVITDCPGCNGSWCEGNTIFLYSPYRPALHRVSASGGTPVQVFQDADAGSYFSYRPLPDGKSLVYGMRVKKAESKDAVSVYAYRTMDGRINRTLFEHTGSPVQYASDGAGNGYLLYILNGQLTARPFDSSKGEITGDPFAVADRVLTGNSFSASQNGMVIFLRQSARRSQLMWVDHDGKAMGTIGEQGDISSPRIAPDQQSVAYSELDSGSNFSVKVLDLKTGNTVRLGQSDERDPSPVWSANGDAVLYGFGSGGKRTVVRCTPGGSNIEEVVASEPGELSPASVSSDGEWLLANQRVRNQALTFLLPLKRKGAPIEVLKDYRRLSRMGHVSLSPNGRWMVFTALVRERLEVLVAPSPKETGGSGGPARWQISQSGGAQPVWRRDGKEIFFLSEGMMMSAAVTESEGNLRIAAPAALFPVNGDEYDATADGKRFLLVQPLAGSSEATPTSVILNWPQMKPQN